MVNFKDLASDSYNSNYTTIKYTYQVKILPRPLSVNIHTYEYDENDMEYGQKLYGQKNSDVEDQFVITYGDWIKDNDEFNALRANNFILAGLESPDLE